jgi:hypothetical protein
VIPKTSNCRKCGLKPKRTVISWSFGDSDDELFLVHKCHGEMIRFPKRGSYTNFILSGQEQHVIEAWNLENEPTKLSRRNP